jgi:hypothetical protein
MSTVRLWRALGLKELKLIVDSEHKKFPPRLYWQPIFYPVTNFAYTQQITREWNVESNGDYCGFVTEFDINQEHLSKYQEQNVGGQIHTEYWIPAEELDAFDANIVGDIRVVASRYSKEYSGPVIEECLLANKSIDEQLVYLHSVLADSEKLKAVFKEAEYAILTNLGFWKRFRKDKEPIVDQLIKIWSKFRPEQKNSYC